MKREKKFGRSCRSGGAFFLNAKGQKAAIADEIFRKKKGWIC